MTISTLSQRSVDKLRQLVKDGYDILKVDFEDLVREQSLQLIDVEIEFNESIELLIPEGKTQEENKDTENCLLLWDALPSLSNIQATDERLWVTLGLRNFKEYSLARWKTSDEDNYQTHTINHWFAAGARARMRDHAISRLWWYREKASRIGGTSARTTLEEMFFNSDYRSSMLERNTSTSISLLVEVVLEITEENKAKGVIYNRSKFREFMKMVDLHAGRSRLAVLTKSQLKEKLSKLYEVAYSS